MSHAPRRTLSLPHLAFLAALVAALVVAAPASADGPRRPNVLKAFAHSEFERAKAGGFNEAQAGIENTTDDRVVVAKVVCTIVYADGRRDTIMRFRNPMKLAPRHGFSAFILFKVPDDAPVGDATVRVTGRLIRHYAAENPAAAHGPRHPYIIATDTFVVVPKPGG